MPNLNKQTEDNRGHSLTKVPTQPLPLKRPESVLVVLFNEQQQVLVLQREDDPNFWQSVTGSMEIGEVPVQTALREVLEETGIDIVGCKLLIADCRQVNQYVIREDWRYRYAQGVTTNFEYVFCVQIPAQSAIHLTEHLQYLWLEKSAAIAKVWSATNKIAIEQFVPKSADKIAEYKTSANVAEKSCTSS
jgi:dATP pyrophosphohydrolase